LKSAWIEETVPLCHDVQMTERYQPPSFFLRDILAENVPLGDDVFGQANLRKLIALTRDEDRANRDWATMLLAGLEPDTPEIRDALLTAASDEDVYVRGEAIVGVARRDPAQALPLLQAALNEEFVCLQAFEAATIVAHPSLVEALRAFQGGEDPIDGWARDALAACEKAASEA
jgi:hypothetical protein